MYDSQQIDTYISDPAMFIIRDFHLTLREILRARAESGNCSGRLIVGIDFALLNEEEMK